jgi:flagellar protein FlbD
MNPAERHAAVIELSRLNGHPIMVNAELVKFVEQNPDTVITLVTGDKLVVREPSLEVMKRILDYRRWLLHHGSRSPLSPASPRSSTLPEPEK